MNPFVKRIFSYGQMIFAALAGLCVCVGAVYAFVDSYATDTEVKEALRLHSIDAVKKEQPLPHDGRFTRIETKLTALRESQAKDQEIVVLLKSTDLETMKILVRRIVADNEPRKTHRMQRAATAQNIFEYWVNEGHQPIEALRRAVRACGRGRSCQVP